MKRLRKQLRSQGGQALVVVAIAMPVFMSVALVVADGSRGFVGKRQMQNAADAAALAAAHDVTQALDPSTCNAACITALRPTVRQTIEDYAVQNGWPGPQLTGGSGSAYSNQCLLASDTDCYTWPFNFSYGKVEVRLKKNVPTFLAGITKMFGFVAGSLDPKARAVGAATGITVSDCRYADGTIDPNWHTGDPPCQRTTGQHPALLFGKGSACNGANTPINISGGSLSMTGGVWSNGGVTVGNGNSGDILVWSSLAGSGCKNLNNSVWTSVSQQPPVSSWPVDPPTRPDATHVTGLVVGQGGSVATVPCTTVTTPITKVHNAITNLDEPKDNSGLTLTSDHLYCSNADPLQINTQDLTLAHMGFVAPSISVGANGGTFTGYQGLYSKYHGLIFMATKNSNGALLMPNANTWDGATFATAPGAAASPEPVGGAQVSGNGNLLSGGAGFVEAWVIHVSGGGLLVGTGEPIGGTTETGTIHTTITGSNLNLDE